MVIYPMTGTETSLGEGQKIMGTEVLVETADKDAFKNFAKGEGKLYGSIGRDEGRRLFGFREHESGRNFPGGRNKASAEDEGVH